ncbi:coagulation factor X-like [Hyperolius riggenbachi]|uniref:coagulation factor X-like n=1 Tax=Hyperolius riggenbachi TaxID=752182 RepID=UPI0035A271AC
MKLLSHILYVTLFLLINSSCYKVFVEKEKAHHVLRKRANHFLEEILPGNLERECYEETCSQEEAREIFKSQEKTTEFWYHYKDLSPCKDNPCEHGGICQQYHYTYTCLCPPRYSGRHCENVRQECWYNNGGCWQYCTDTPRSLSVICSCAQGYTLEENGKKCAKTVSFPCGLTASSSRSLLDLEMDLELSTTVDSSVTASALPVLTDPEPSPESLNDSSHVTVSALPALTAPGPSSGGSNDSTNLSHSNETVWGQSTANVSVQQFAVRGNNSQPYNRSGEHGAFKVPASAGNTTHKNSTMDGKGHVESLLVEDDQARIVGGMLCELGQCPWQVSIRTNRGIDFCGGSLISQRWVVSAAHCFEDVIPHHITTGDFDKHLRDREEQKIAVLQVFSHPYYIAEHYDHDIALLHLRSPVIYSEHSRPICLPTPNLGRLLTQEGEVGQVSGWGATRYLGRYSRFLLKVRLPVVSQDACIASTGNVVTGNMFCAGYASEAKDACKGDSGGPFAVLFRNTWYLTGVVSWGEGCAAEGKYGVYTRVSNYISWIKDTIIETEGINESLASTL